jgi:hypothetical protein
LSQPTDPIKPKPPTNVGPLRIELLLFQRREVVAGVLGALFTLFLLAFVISLVPGWTLLGLSTSNALTGLLAMGTFALAYAATTQAYLAAQKRKEDLRPHLYIELYRSTLTVGPVTGSEGRGEAILVSPVSTELPRDRTLKLLLRNLGPGNAINLNFTVWVWEPDQPSRKWNDRGQLGDLSTPPLGTLPLAENIALPPGPGLQFDFELAQEARGTAWGPNFEYRVKRQFLVTANATDVIGTQVTATPVGFYLTQLMRPIGDPEEGLVDGLWVRFTSDRSHQLARICEAGWLPKPTT